ncbi:acetoacetate decarboxylase family protein [Streptomyces sp. NPDC004609]|uniref:acetoacetate decarboxylase family protein n=1 Tax=Streptomyces sp. NPDC004609 TaxID=3364704 RepID=UPI0036ABD1E9
MSAAQHQDATPGRPPVSMPAFAPPYGVGSESVSLRWLTVEYRTRPETIAALLPEPLRPTGDPRVAIWVAEFMGAAFRLPDGSVEQRPPYMQAGVSVRCRRGDEIGAYPLIFFIEGLNHGTLGREIFGLPKKQARSVTLEQHAGAVTGRIVTANGIEVVTVTGHAPAVAAGAAPASTTVHAPVTGGASAAVSGHAPAPTPSGDTPAAVTGHAPTTGDRPGDPIPAWFAHHFTLKLIPSAEGRGWDVNRIVRVPFRTSDAHDGWTGTGEVSLAPSAADPLHLVACEDPDLDERTQESMTELAALPGCLSACPPPSVPDSTRMASRWPLTRCTAA